MAKQTNDTKTQILIIIIVILVVGGLSSIAVRLYLHAHPRNGVVQTSGTQEIVVTQWGVLFPTGVKNIDFIYQVANVSALAGSEQINITTDRFSNATCTGVDGTTTTNNTPIAVMYRMANGTTPTGAQSKTIGEYRYSYELTSEPAGCNLGNSTSAFKDAQNQFKKAFDGLAAS